MALRCPRSEARTGKARAVTMRRWPREPRRPTTRAASSATSANIAPSRTLTGPRRRLVRPKQLSTPGHRPQDRKSLTALRRAEALQLVADHSEAAFCSIMKPSRLVFGLLVAAFSTGTTRPGLGEGAAGKVPAPSRVGRSEAWRPRTVKAFVVYPEVKTKAAVVLVIP